MSTQRDDAWEEAQLRARRRRARRLGELAPEFTSVLEGEDLAYAEGWLDQCREHDRATLISRLRAAAGEGLAMEVILELEARGLSVEDVLGRSNGKLVVGGPATAARSALVVKLKHGRLSWPAIASALNLSKASTALSLWKRATERGGPVVVPGGRWGGSPVDRGGVQVSPVRAAGVSPIEPPGGPIGGLGGVLAGAPEPGSTGDG